jgi:hypothetical protein
VIGLSIGVIVQNVEANMKHHIGASRAVSNRGHEEEQVCGY